MLHTIFAQFYPEYERHSADDGGIARLHQTRLEIEAKMQSTGGAADTLFCDGITFEIGSEMHSHTALHLESSCPESMDHRWEPGLTA